MSDLGGLDDIYLCLRYKKANWLSKPIFLLPKILITRQPVGVIVVIDVCLCLQ